jgi:hypothetical protein
MISLTLNYADLITAEVGFDYSEFTDEQKARIQEFAATCAERGYATGYAAGS